MFQLLRILALTAFCCFAGTPMLAQSVSVTKIAENGDGAPGTQVAGGGPDHFAVVSHSFPNNAGEVVFRASLVEALLENKGVWSTVGGTLQLVSFVAELFPGRQPMINDLGEVAFWGRPPSESKDGIWLDTGSSLVKVVEIGDTMPGFEPETFSSLANTPGLTNFGHVVFTATGTESTGGVWMRDLDGSLVPLAIGGEAFDETTDYVGLHLGNPPRDHVSSYGHIAFGATLNQGGPNFTAIVGGDVADSLQIYVQTGDAADGTSGTFTGFLFFGPSANALGEIAFRAKIGSGSGTQGVWKSDGQGNELVALQGQSAPGTSSTFSEFGAPTINVLGEVAFAAAAGTLEGIWRLSEGTLSPIAIEGDSAPGTTVTFSTFKGINDQGPILNDVGQVAFIATLSDGKRGLFATARDGTLVLIRKAGEIDPDLGETIENVLIHPGGNKQGNRGQTVLNDFGQVAMTLDFSTGSVTTGIYLAEVVEACSAKLCAAVGAISMTTGGRQDLEMDFGASCGGESYWVLGSVTGTDGFTFMGSTIPLTFDWYTNVTINEPNTGILENTLGVEALDAQGVGSAAIVFSESVADPSFAGLKLYHAAVAFDAATSTVCDVSNPVEVVLVP